MYCPIDSGDNNLKVINIEFYMRVKIVNKQKCRRRQRKHISDYNLFIASYIPPESICTTYAPKVGSCVAMHQL